MGSQFRADCHVFEKTLAFDGTPLLFDHKVEGVGIIPAAAQLEMAIAAARVVNPKHEYVLLNAVFRTPIEVPKGRRFYLASQWIISAAIGRSGRPMAEKLALELISAANGDGGAIKKKDDTHRMAEANKAFAHFR